jgi:type III secretion system YscD/HrpQ family protein
MKLLLKILSGVNAGAEALLPAGEYVLGRAEDCDFVLSDAAAAPRHAKLTVSEDAAQLAALEAPVLLQGEPVQGDGAPLEAFQVFTLGGTHCCVGPADQDWPKLSLPALVRAGGAAEAAPQGTEAAAAAGGEAEKARAGAGGGAAAAGTARSAGSGAKTTADEAAATSGARRRRVAIVLGAAVVCVALLWGLWALVKTPELPIDDGKARLAAVVERLRQQKVRCWIAAAGSDDAQEQRRRAGQQGVRVSQAADGSVRVAGVVPNDGIRAKANEALSGLSPPVSAELKTLDEVLAAARKLLAEKRLSLEVEPEGWGGVRLKGFTRDAAARDSATALLNSILPGGLDLRCSVVTWDLLGPALNAALRKQGFRALTLKPLETRVAVEGSIAFKEVEKWERLRAELDGLFCVPITLDGPAVAPPPVEPVAVAPPPEVPKTTTPPAAQEKKTTPGTTENPGVGSEVRQPRVERPPEIVKPGLPDCVKIDLAHPRRFQSSDGTWHDEGAVLDCGFVVKEVFRQGVVLTRDDELVLLALKLK